MDRNTITHGDWTIEYDPPPIPCRKHDWAFSHRDFDADFDGESFVGNGLCGTAESVEACLAEIAEIEAEHPHFARETA